EQDYEALGTLKALADAHSVAVCVIHHTRKSDAEDPLDTVSGTLGLTGAADAVLVLKRQRYNPEGALCVTGRDLDEQQITVRFDSQYALWSIVTKDNGGLHPEERKALEILKEAGRPLTPQEATPRLGKSYEAVKKLLRRMADDGLVI